VSFISGKSISELRRIVPGFAAKKLDELFEEFESIESDDRLTEEGRHFRAQQLVNLIGVWVQYSQAVEPMREELRGAGFIVAEISELIAPGVGSAAAEPILTKWLPKVDFLPLKKDIASALGCPWAHPFAMPALLTELKETRPELDLGVDSLRGRIADAIEKSLRPGEVDVRFLAGLIEFVTDPRQGLARGFIVMALGKLEAYRAEVLPVLVGLLEDDEMVVAAVIALGRLRAVEALDFVELKLRSHQVDPWMLSKVKVAKRRMSGE